VRTKMNLEKIGVALQSLSSWQLLRSEKDEQKECLRLNKRFLFRNFSEAWAFMSRVALLAERLNHHPNWSNVNSSVEITLYTHDLEGLSSLDFKMAAAIEEILASEDLTL
jgi:4a-hydroxytetrahydrobiopterin dehydratase